LPGPSFRSAGSRTKAGGKSTSFSRQGKLYELDQPSRCIYILRSARMGLARGPSGGLRPWYIRTAGPRATGSAVRHPVAEEDVIRLRRCEQTIRGFCRGTGRVKAHAAAFPFPGCRGSSGWIQLRFNPSNSGLAQTIGSTRWRIVHFICHFPTVGLARSQARTLSPCRA
jgi:hypothetical protein